tara:strand:+ start:243 stop:515 length:273 start_codon:yes stop_codon:yes gene_type:complete
MYNNWSNNSIFNIQTNKKINKMANGNGNGTKTEVVWFGNSTAFNVGDRPVKVWEVIVGIIVLAIIAPIFYGGGGNRGGNGYRNGGGRGRR